MKKSLLTITFIAVVVFAFASSKGNSENGGKSSEATSIPAVSSVSISGKVIDFNSGESLAGVEVAIVGSTQKVHTDFDGNFTIENVKPGSYNLIASFISYNKSFIEKLNVDKSGQPLKIKLQSEN